MALTLDSPYSNESLPWLKGNLHTHTTNSDGDLTPQATVQAYADLGRDFLMISDHDHFTNPADLDPRGMILIPGNEITALGPHLLHVNARRCIGPEADRQATIDAINADGGFCIVNHATWLVEYNHCDQKLLETWRDYTGMEIFNGVVRRAEGSALSTDRWDRILSTGRKVWGFANDDSHEACDRGLAWNVVQCEKASRADIVRSMRQGRFYASTGVAIDRIQVEGAALTIDSADTQRYYVVSEHGRVLEALDGPRLDYRLPENFAYPYIRVECWGAGDAMAWTQPFFINGESA